MEAHAFEDLSPTPFNLLLVNKIGRITYASKGTTDLTKYDEQHLTNFYLSDLFPKYTLKEWQNNWENLSFDVPQTLNVVCKTKNNNLLSVSVEVALVRHNRQKMGCLLLRDASKSNLELSLYQNCAQKQQIAPWVWHLIEGSFYTTDLLYDIFAISKDDYPNERTNITHILRRHLNPEQMIGIMQSISRLQETQEAYQTTFHIKVGDVEKVIYFEYYPILENKRVVKIEGIIKDVTDTEKSNHLLKLAKLAVDESIDMAFFLESQNNLYYVNAATCQQLGYEKQELVDVVQMQKIDIETTFSEWQHIRRTLETTSSLTVETIFQRKDGTVFPVEMRLSLLQQGDIDLLSIVATDITERRKKDAEIQSMLMEINSMSRQLEAENVILQQEISSGFKFENIITASDAYQETLELVQRVAPTQSTVLIEGETGTGKELLSRAIHNLSSRKHRPLLTVNCSALPKELIESELFGHEKGAFTGADKQKLGRFEVADKGTIFLDEIGELPLDMQVKLLRFLQEGEFERLGSNKTISVDVRIIAATNRKLLEMVKDKTFREDLYYRLNVFPIENIPLRKRKEDIPLLIEHFTQKYNKKVGKKITAIKPKDLKRLTAYDFPGNIRELENIIERATILTAGNVLNLSYWNPAPANSDDDESTQKFRTFEEMQKEHILKALERTKWLVSGKDGAAKLLGMKDQTLFSKMRKFGISRKD